MSVITERTEWQHMDGLPDGPKPLSLKICLSAAPDLKVHKRLKCKISDFFIQLLLKKQACNPLKYKHLFWKKTVTIF